MSRNGLCVSYSVRICQKDSGHMQLKLPFILSITVQLPLLTTRPLSKHGQGNAQASNTYIHLEKQATYTSRWKRTRNGLGNPVHVDFLDTHHDRGTTSCGIPINAW